MPYLAPLHPPPFTPWAHVSPIMTRPKADSSQRRVITDLTFPREKSINAYIMKNSALGIVRDHSLPSISDLVGELRHMGQSAYMFTLDIARAYKNFMSDPLDWPLLCVQWKDKYYVETSMPFGSRASSCFMQRVANFITRVLRSEGIIAIMYLDDVIVISPDRTIADTQYARVRELLAELGLPEAVDKAQPPAQAVHWLGVDIDAVNMSLSMPNDKLKEVMLAVDRYHNARSINKRQLQSLVGKLVNVAKCVDPARAFIARLLDALRAFGDRQFIKVTQEMRADLQWFREFVYEWNGTSLIPAVTPHKIIQVDACLTGIGAMDGTRAYAACVAQESDPISNITEIEAANVVIALHTFITPEDAGGHIMVQCDNMSAVQALTSSRAHNPILAECARANWMLQAIHNVKISISHIPGVDNPVADALSRAHTTSAHHELAREHIVDRALTLVRPCSYILSSMYPPILCRSGAELVSGPGGEEAGRGACPGDDGGTQECGRAPGRILRQVQDGPNGHVARGGVHVARVPRNKRSIPWNAKKQGVPRARICSPSGWEPDRI